MVNMGVDFMYLIFLPFIPRKACCLDTIKFCMQIFKACNIFQDLYNMVFIHSCQIPLLIKFIKFIGGARGIMVIVVGSGYGDMSSNPGRD